MRRWLLMLMVVVFGVAHAAAAPYALCRHADLEAHSAALQSSDAGIAAEAHREDAAKAASKAGSLSDNVSASLAIAVLPEQVGLAMTFGQGATLWDRAESDGLSGRAIAPLLEPPAA